MTGTNMIPILTKKNSTLVIVMLGLQNSLILRMKLRMCERKRREFLTSCSNVMKYSYTSSPKQATARYFVDCKLSIAVKMPPPESSKDVKAVASDMVENIRSR